MTRGSKYNKFCAEVPDEALQRKKARLEERVLQLHCKIAAIETSGPGALKTTLPYMDPISGNGDARGPMLGLTTSEDSRRRARRAFTQVRERKLHGAFQFRLC